MEDWCAGRLKFNFSVTNQDGDVTTLVKEVPENYLDYTELEIYLDAFKRFLSAAGFAIDYRDELELMRYDSMGLYQDDGFEDVDKLPDDCFINLVTDEQE